MPRPKPTKQDLKDRVTRAKEWRSWMKENLFTEKKLAEVTGISRRTIQMIRAGKVTPHFDTLRIFSALQAKYRDNFPKKKAKKRAA